MAAPKTIYTVTQINNYIKGILDEDRNLSGVYIRGEISNYKKYPSGHHYFTLKDPNGSLRCVMFRSNAVRLRFQPEGGMKVIAYGRITAFPRDGQYQLYVDTLTPDGAGELYLAFEQLKNKLYQEGLFAPERKKAIPRYPETIALITSQAGAAVQDMIRILGTRWPMAAVKLMPVRVQGQGAAAELTGAVRYANQWQVAELLVIGRGGGSMEDLWAFNDEQLARAAYASDIPIISAVGHEPDVTIIDYVADLRAATPSNGAELAVPDQLELKQYTDQLGLRCRQAMLARFQAASHRLQQLCSSRALADPMALVEAGRMRLEQGQRAMMEQLDRRRQLDRSRLTGLASTLDALSPLKVLGRGYAFAKDEDGAVITSVHDVDLGERIVLRVADGQLGCTVMEQTPFEKTGKERTEQDGGKEETL